MHGLYPYMVSIKIYLLGVHTPLTGYGWYISVECCIFSVHGWTKTWSARTLIKQATLATTLPS